MILEELLVRPVAIEPCLCYTDQHGIMIDEEIFYYEWSENPLRYKATRDLSRNSTTLQDVHISWQMDPTEEQLKLIEHHEFDEE